ncbi:hypothetical protein ONZ45_g6961 [Pleurotus djamor]|nr:hypothetical protein ONZ45_g6961 [Pleurotus djamor]
MASSSPPFAFSSSSTSEFDSSSDSEWLEISSNRSASPSGGDDSDSELDRDDLSSVPLSRTSSSISLGSSRDGEIEAWEGLIEETDVQQPMGHDLDMTAGTVAQGDLAVSVDLSGSDSTHREPDDDEDMRVRAALDQSMISTLSASRSSSSPTAHNSFHDLRLSFPDPLTSSKDELTRSYERLAEEELSQEPPQDISEPDASAEEPIQPVQASLPEKLEDATIPETLSDLRHQLVLDRLHNIKFEISLYGCTSVEKWSFVETLLQKMAMGGGCLLMSPSQDDSQGATRWFAIDHLVGDKYERASWIAVHDRTGDNMSPTSSFVRSPSLAIIYLPSFIPPALPKHNLYLPVFVPFPSSIDPLGSGELTRRAAQDTWELLDIPTSKVLRLNGKSSSAILDSDYIRNVDSRHTFLMLQQLSKKQVPGFSVALITIISLILGVIMNSAFRTSVPTPTISSSSTLAIRPSGHLAIQTSSDVVHVTRPVSTNHSSTLAPSSLKDFALAVISPSSTSLSVRRASVPSVVPSLTFKPTGKCGQSATLSVSVRDAPRDVIVRPSSSISPVPGPSQPQVSSVATKLVTSTASSSPTALSIRLADSLAQIYGDAAKAVVQMVSQDVKELMEALDALLQAIGTQTTVVVEKSKGKAKDLKRTLKYRNERAKKRARDLKDMGDKFMMHAGEHLKDRATQAKKTARKLKDSLSSSGAVQACWKAHEGTTRKLVQGLVKHSETIRAVAMSHAASKDKIAKGLTERTKQRKRTSMNTKRSRRLFPY